MFHLLNYFVSAGANAANTDMTAAVTDGSFSSRNSHYVLSEPYNLLWWAGLSTSITDMRLNVPHINALARHHLWPVMRSIQPTSPPRVAVYKDYPFPLPLGEEIAVETSGNLGCGNEDATAFLCIATPTWNQNLPRSGVPGQNRVTIRATASVAIVGDAWSLFGNLTFAEQLRGGFYAVCGAWVQGATPQRAFRLNFPRSPLYQGRKLLPGGLITAAVGNEELKDISKEMGVWGIFHSFEPVQLQIYGDTTGAATQVVLLDLIYLGDQGGYGPVPGQNGAGGLVSGGFYG